jgi:hypothetical protein
MSTCVRVCSYVRVCAVCQCVCVSPFICVCSRETVPKCTRVGCDVGRETRVTKWVKSDELCATGCSRDDPRLRHAADSLSRLASARVHDTGETVLWPAVCSRPNWNDFVILTLLVTDICAGATGLHAWRLPCAYQYCNIAKRWWRVTTANLKHAWKTNCERCWKERCWKSALNTRTVWHIYIVTVTRFSLEYTLHHYTRYKLTRY